MCEDNRILFANTLGDAQKLMWALVKFCMHMKLSFNNSKRAILLVKSQNKNKQCIMYNNEPLETIYSFKYLCLEVSSNYKWNEYATCCLETGKTTYYAIENTCNH